jgi:hypothetical protein
MNRLLSLFFAAVSAACCNAQFSGKITYQDAYISKSPNVSSDNLEKLIGTKRELYIQDANYESIYWGETKSTMLYRGDENKLYRFNNGADTIFWIDASRDTLFNHAEYKLSNSDETVLGLVCKKLTIRSKLGVTTYYFNSVYSIDPLRFRQHHFDGWDLYTAYAKSVPLKIVFEGELASSVSTAVKIEPAKLDSIIFKCPPGILRKMF